MTDTQQTPKRSYRTGAAAAKEGGGFATSRAGFFKLGDGDRAFVQFVTDPWEWITVDMHSLVHTKPQPSDWEGNWPTSVTPVCRRNKIDQGGALVQMFDDCYVCDFIKDKDGKPWKRSSRTWALGVLREEVLGDGSPENGGAQWLGRRRGFKNKMVEMLVLGPDGTPAKGPDGKATGEKKMVPEVVIFTMGWKNFFSAIQGAALVNGGTIANLTFAIQRSGTGLETTYSVTSMGTGKQDFNDPKYAEKIGVKVDWNNLDADSHPDKVYPPEYDLPKMLDHRASDEFYGRFIDPRISVPSGKKTEPKPSNEVEPENLKSMRERIMGWSETGAGEDSGSESPAAAITTEQGSDDVDLIQPGGVVDFDEE